MNSQINKDPRANVLGDRLEQGANALIAFAEKLSDSDWKKPTPGDGRTVGVVVHHVASVYPVEIELAKTLASGQPITGATKKVIDEMNATHAQENANVEKKETLDLLHRNSKAAADAIRSFSDDELDNAAKVSLNANAPLTAQFFIEDHALRHSFHHLAQLQEALNR